MAIQETTRDHCLAFRSRPEKQAVDGSRWDLDEPRNEEVERILLLRSASLELRRILTGS